MGSVAAAVLPAPMNDDITKGKKPSQSVSTLESKLIGRIEQSMEGMVQSYIYYIPEHKGMYTMCKYSNFKYLLQRLLNGLNVRLGDYNGWESTGVRCAVLAIIFLERAKNWLHPKHFHAFFTAAFILAFKANDDESLPMSFFASTAGFDMKDLQNMEIALANMMDWDFYISERNYRTIREKIVPV